MGNDLKNHHLRHEKEDLSHFAINEEFYDWAVRTFQRVESKIGLNIKVHNNEQDVLGRGQIFLFNHFARFETLIPPYIIHRHTGSYCRSVADHDLFKVGDKFGKVMREVGAVPNNIEGLLPFLAAEILRGRKVVIFPEGGMIKDRRVMDDQGQLRIFSPTSQTYRKHHRGAAVLALMLDLFKRRIRDVCEANDTRRMEHWRRSLGFSTVEALLEQAQKPTLIVPSTITFYPIRIDDNIISRTLDLFGKKVSRSVIEEMMVEGNILFKDTDMDIRLGDPIQPHLDWHWWEKMLLNRYFEQIQSLDDLFGFHEASGRMTERLIVRAISKETGRIRDAYMEGMYKGITINLAHLASELFVYLLDSKVDEISHERLARTLYISLKALQKEEGVNLHRSLIQPDRYRGLLAHQNHDLKRFLFTCAQAGLIAKTKDGYKLLPALRNQSRAHDIRLENPVLVSANEAAPVRQVRAQVVEAYNRSTDPLSQAELSLMLMDDEQRAYAYARGHYSQHVYQGLNTIETATKSGQPYLLVPPGTQKAKVGVVLVHALMSSPAELRPLAEALHSQGMAVMGVRLDGHGTSPWDLENRTLDDWLGSIRRGRHILAPHCEKMVLVGDGSGGALALLLAAAQTAKNNRLDGVITCNVPIAVRDLKYRIMPLISRMERLITWAGKDNPRGLFREYTPNDPEVGYTALPVNAVKNFKLMTRNLKDTVSQVAVPCLFLQGDKDTVVDPKNAQFLADKVAATDKQVHKIKGGGHTALAKNTGKVWDTVIDFINTTIKAD